MLNYGDITTGLHSLYLTEDCYKSHSVDQSNCHVRILAGSVKDSHPIGHKFLNFRMACSLKISFSSPLCQILEVNKDDVTVTWTQWQCR